MFTCRSRVTGGNMDGQQKKPWIRSIQGWSWVITAAWMVTANLWHPFGLFGFACMLSPLLIALSGRGKMHCGRVCPRGSFIWLLTKKISLRRERPAFMGTRAFHWALWGCMMGTFACLLVWAIPRGIDTLGYTILVFMEAATGLALIFGVVFAPRAWCAVCPMGFTTGNIRDLLARRAAAVSDG